MLKIEITNDDGLCGICLKKGKKIVGFNDLSLEELDKISSSLFGAIRLVEIALKGKNQSL